LTLHTNRLAFLFKCVKAQLKNMPRKVVTKNSFLCEQRGLSITCIIISCKKKEMEGGVARSVTS